jgi:hypothetical protein
MCEREPGKALSTTRLSDRTENETLGAEYKSMRRKSSRERGFEVKLTYKRNSICKFWTNGERRLAYGFIIPSLFKAHTVFKLELEYTSCPCLGIYNTLLLMRQAFTYSLHCTIPSTMSLYF